MLTVDYDRIGDWRRASVLDLGCGKGRHSFEALKRGASVVALDLDEEALREVAGMSGAIRAEGEAPPGGVCSCVRATGLRLPFAAGAFDVVIASEVLEHVPRDREVMKEIARVLRPGGVAAVSVPRSWPERVCWALSNNYHAQAGGHVRIYSESELASKLKGAGFETVGSHHAHALHSPYWWLKCALGSNGNGWPSRAYHDFLVWDLMHPTSPLRLVERALNPVLGKSLVVYARKEPAAS